MSDFKSQKKVELHLHVEGAASPDFIRKLASEQGRDLSGVFDATGAYKWSDFTEFLAVYEAASAVLEGPDEYRRLMEAVLADQAAQGVVYTEHFLAPDLCGGGDEGAWREYLAAMEAGADAAEAAHGITVRFIPTAIRHFGPQKAVNTAQLSAACAGGRVTGFGMGGDERHLMPQDFAPAYDIARDAGLGLTVHAGEFAGPEMVSASLDALKVTRIGHGVRAIENPDLVARLAGEGVTLECNPGSNVALGVYPDWDAHPISKLREQGVNVTVSTDDPPYFHTDMTREYDMLARHHGWSAHDLRAQNVVAMDAAFCDTETRNRIKALL